MPGKSKKFVTGERLNKIIFMNDLYEIIDPSSNTSPETRINTWVFIGYIVSLFGGLFGIFIATFLINAKKTLPGGQIIYAFNERSRKHGKIILYLGSIILIASILFFLNWLFLTFLFSNRLHFGSFFQSLPTQF
jgi:hypothetical protein